MKKVALLCAAAALLAVSIPVQPVEAKSLGAMLDSAANALSGRSAYYNQFRYGGYPYGGYGYGGYGYGGYPYSSYYGNPYSNYYGGYGYGGYGLNINPYYGTNYGYGWY
jgi:hypothetical protein